MKSGFQVFPSASGRRPAPRAALAAGRWPRTPDPNRHTSAVVAGSLSPRHAGPATHTGRSGVLCCRQLFRGCSSSREAVEPTREVPSGVEDLPQGAAATLAPSPRGPPPAPPPA